MFIASAPDLKILVQLNVIKMVVLCGRIFSLSLSKHVFNSFFEVLTLAGRTKICTLKIDCNLDNVQKQM